MNTIVVDTPAINLREEASVASIQITPSTLQAFVQVKSTDLGTARVLGIRNPTPQSGSPVAFGTPIADLPTPVQDAINVIADHLLAQPYIFT